MSDRELESEQFIPEGEPLPIAELLSRSLFTLQDLEQAVVTAHPSLKPYLRARRYRTGERIVRGL